MGKLHTGYREKAAQILSSPPGENMALEAGKISYRCALLPHGPQKSAQWTA